jgi:hypothetical protein
MGFANSVSQFRSSTKYLKKPRARVKKFNESEPPEFFTVKPVPADSVPRWVDAVRGMAPALLRGELFGVFHDKERQQVKEHLMSTARGTLLLYSGELPNQCDLNVHTEILHLFRGKNLDEEVRVSLNELLRRLGLKRSGQNLAMLRASISRLINAIVKLSIRDEKFEVTLLYINNEQEANNVLAFKLDKNFGKLFPNNTWCQFNPDVRKALGKNLLARWLHAYYATHVHPFPTTVETIHQLCGSRQTDEREFRRQLKNAFQTIKDASKLYNENFDFTIAKSDGKYKVSVAPHQSRSQRRYVEKNAIQPVMLKERKTLKNRHPEKTLPSDKNFNDEEEF